MRRRTNIRLSKAVGFVLEELEYRRLLSSTPWGTQAVLVHQDQAVANYPWITGAGETIAVLDTGVDYNDSLLGGGFGPGYKIEAGYNYINNTGNPMDDDGHGTGVSGLLAAESYTYTDSATGLTAQFQGIAPGVNLVVVAYDNGGFGTGTQDLLEDALNWVVANRTTYNIVAVNISNGFGNYGSPYVSPIFGTDLATLAGDGVFIAAASGNSGTQYPNEVESPAADPNVYAVGSVDLSGNISSFTQAGSLLDLLAPGNQVTLPYYVPSTDSAILLDVGEGTSFSTPQVTGAAALLKQIDPDFTPAQIAQILDETGTPVYDAATSASYPLLNLDAAIAQAYVSAGEAYGAHNTLASAIPISFDDSGVATVDGQVLLVHNDNYYSFTISSSSSVEFALGTDGASPPPFSLYNSNGALVANLGTNDTLSLSAGTYYLKVTAGLTASMTGTYNFSVINTGSISTPPPEAGANGVISSAAYAPNGTLFLAWFDEATQTLDFAERPSHGSWSETQQVDPEAGVGENLSLAINPSNEPSIAYYDAQDAELRYAQYNGSSWVTETVDTHGGADPSLAFASSGLPAISYYNNRSEDLRFAVMKRSVWDIATIDSTKNVGQDSSLALDPATGRFGIAYQNTGRGTFSYANQTSRGWNLQTVDSTTRDSGGGISLAFNHSDQPAFSYFDAYNGDLKFAQLNSNGKWEFATVASKGVQGVYTSLSFLNHGAADILYFDRKSDAVFSAVGSIGAFTLSDVADDAGQYLSVAYNPLGGETLVFYNPADNGLDIEDE